MLKGKPSVVVLQALWPADKIDLALSAYRVRWEIPVQIPVFAYNFGSKAVRGQLHATAPDGWTVQFPDALALAPQERRELTLIAEAAATPAKLPFSVRVRGDFGPAGNPVLSLRLVEEKPAK